jgi:hypothetical protein
MKFTDDSLQEFLDDERENPHFVDRKRLLRLFGLTENEISAMMKAIEQVSYEIKR